MSAPVDHERQRLVDRVLGDRPTTVQLSPRLHHNFVVWALIWLLTTSGLSAALHMWLQVDTRTVVATFKRSGEFSWMMSQNLLWSGRLQNIAMRSLIEPWGNNLSTEFENARDVFFHRASLIVSAHEFSAGFKSAPSYAVFNARILNARDALDRVRADGPEGLKAGDARAIITLLRDLDPVMTRFMVDLRSIDLDGRASIFETLMARRDWFRWALGGTWIILTLGGLFVLWTRAQSQQDLLTRRQALEHKLAAMQTAEELLETRNSILNMVAHDLRSPLQVLMSTAEMLQLKLPQQEVELRKLATLIDHTTEQIATHLRDLSSFAKALEANVSTQTQSLDLDMLVEQAYGQHLKDRAASKGIEVRIAVDGMRRGLLGDRTRLTQILGNLIDNAIKYTDQGSVHVMVETRPLNERAVMLTFSVTDTGVGMTPPSVQKAFEPFTRLGTDQGAERPGYGIGLSLVKHLVEVLRGSLEVRSTPGIGSAFVVKLPTVIARGGSATPPVDQGAASFQQISGNSATVLVVDDVPEVLQALTESVRRQGAVALGANNATEALALANVHTIDVAFIDYQMPVRNGMSLAAELSRRHPDLQITIISAFPEPEVFAPDALAAVGAQGFAEKPLNGATIRRLIDIGVTRARAARAG